MRIRITIDFTRDRPDPEPHPSGDVYAQTELATPAPLGFTSNPPANPDHDWSDWT